MSRFYGDIKAGGKPPVSRQGSTASGLEAHVRGFYFGVRVSLGEGPEGLDTARIYLTTGSKGESSEDILLGSFDCFDLSVRPKGE